MLTGLLNPSPDSPTTEPSSPPTHGNQRTEDIDNGMPIQITERNVLPPPNEPRFPTRVRFLRISAAAQTRRGINGITPPFCPLGPPLQRVVLDDTDENPPVSVTIRQQSPLRNLAFTNVAQSFHSRYDSAHPSISVNLHKCRIKL